MSSGTSTASIERVDARDFRADLNAHLDNEAANQRRAESVEFNAHDLIQAGREYDPWTFDHFVEAIGNAPEIDLKILFATIASAVDFKLDNQYANYTALHVMRKLVEQYWLGCARQEAEKNG